jgi:glycosyltransferase involved in cell wall biosynthesis
VVLFAGQLLERKGILPLLDVWSAMSVEERGGCELWIAGTGPLASEVQRHIATARLGSVRVLGAVSPAGLAAVFARTSLLVMPSLVEVWGMVVNEAMAGGIPVLVSEHCGAAELVLDGVNGALFDPRDVNVFRARLVEWIARSKAIDPEAIRLHLARWSIEGCEHGVFSGIKQVLGMERSALRS